MLRINCRNKIPDTNMRQITKLVFGVRLLMSKFRNVELVYCDAC